MSIDFAKVSKNICSILINRPEKRNALNLDLIRELRSAIDTFETDDELSVAILGGHGSDFCAGYDLNEFIDNKTGLANMNQIEQMLLPLGTRLSSKKITVAAIEGHAAGVGYELALRCDYRIADKNARLGFMNRRFGIPIMNGGSVILPRYIGYSRAADLVGTGRAQLSPDALQFGLLSQVCGIGCSLGVALNLARCLAKFDQRAVQLDLKGMLAQKDHEDSQLLVQERDRALDYLASCGPLTNGLKFLQGKICRHGNYDVGNLLQPDPVVTL